MSDFNSSLPVRTQTNGDVVAQLVDGTILSQKLSINANGAITDVSDGPTTPGVAATRSGLIGGQYNTVLPVLTNTQQAAVQVDSNGRLLVSTTPASAEDRNYGLVGANTLRTASQIGNATGAANFNIGATTAQTLRVEANQGEANLVADAWPIKITDGTDTVNVSATGELSVFATAQPGVDIGDVTVNNGPGAAAVNIQDGGNSITVDGTVTLSEDHNYGVVGANTLRTAAQIGNSTGAADFNAGVTTAQTLRVVANIMSSAGTAFSNANPLPVSFSTSPLGTEINNYNTATVAAGATSNHDYTVTAGMTFELYQIWAAASGKLKIEVQVETGVATGIFTTKFVGFNSTATPNIDLDLMKPITVAAGVRVRVIRTNLDNQSQDVYSTISGSEI